MFILYYTYSVFVRAEEGHTEIEIKACLSNYGVARMKPSRTLVNKVLLFERYEGASENLVT